MTETDVKTAVLHRKLAEHMDTETADALIERLPPDWEQLATKTDLARLETRVGAVEARMDSLEATLEARMDSLEARMGTLASTLASTLATGMESLQAKLGAMEGRINRRAASDLKALMFAFAGFALAVVGLFVAVLVSGVPAAG